MSGTCLVWWRIYDWLAYPGADDHRGRHIPVTVVVAVIFLIVPIKVVGAWVLVVHVNVVLVVVIVRAFIAADSVVRRRRVRLKVTSAPYDASQTKPVYAPRRTGKKEANR